MLNKAKLFAISLLPMWAMIMAKSFDIPIYLGQDWKFCGFCRLFTPTNCVFLFTSYVFLWALYCLHQLNHLKKGTPLVLPRKIASIENRNQDYLNSLSTLITLCGLLFVKYESVQDVIQMVILLFVIYVCYTSTNMYYCNPVFATLGYKIAVVEFEDNSDKNADPSIILYKGEKKLSDYFYDIHHLSDNVYLAR